MSGTALKITALVLMTIDHAGEFFGLPIWFRWIGRLSAPIFFFCAAEGMTHTRDRKGYLKRLWKMSLVMELIKSAVPPFMLFAFGIRVEYLQNNIFATIFQGALVIYLLEETKNDVKKRLKYLLAYVGYQLLMIILYIIWENRNPIGMLNNIPIIKDAGKFIFTALGSVLFIEGTVYLTFAIVLFYLCRENKKRLAVWYTVYCGLFFAFTVFQLPARAAIYLADEGAPMALVEVFLFMVQLAGFQIIPFSGSFSELTLNMNYQWMMFFALPIMLAYNGEKGRGLKKLFYIYYPAHLVVFSIVSVLIKG